MVHGGIEDPKAWCCRGIGTDVCCPLDQPRQRVANRSACRPAPKPGAASQPGDRKPRPHSLSKTAMCSKNCKKQLAGFAVRVLAGIPPDVAQDDNIASQRHAVETAKTEFQAAKGAREFAELALAEYREGIAKQEQAALEAELKLAQDELKHATSRIEQAKERYAKIKAASNGSAYDLSQEWRFDAGIVSANGRNAKLGLRLNRQNRS